MEREAEDAEPADPAARARTEEERALLRAGRGDVASAPLRRIEGAHASNVLAVRLWPGRDALVTGSGARTRERGGVRRGWGGGRDAEGSSCLGAG
jgi:hypothetical protein